MSDTSAFTITNARYIAAKVGTDLKRIQRFYGSPNDIDIRDYEEELIVLLANRCIDRITYGFRRDGVWVEPTLKYTAYSLETSSDDDPGKVRPNANIVNASFGSFLVYNSVWYSLPQADRQRIKDQLPVIRTSATEPGSNGVFTADNTYSSGGRNLSRSSLRTY